MIVYPLNNRTYTAEDVETYLAARTQGVFAVEDNFAASCTGTDRQITIGPGQAWIRNGSYTGKSVTSKDSVILTADDNSSNYTRIDRIVLRFSTDDNDASILLVKGTPAEDPEAPELLREESGCWDLGLYTVTLPADGIYVTATDIHNTMLDETVCGVMTDGATGLPTGTYQAQFDSLVGTLETTLRNLQVDVLPAVDVTYDDTATALGAGNLQAAVPALLEKIGAVSDALKAHAANCPFNLLETITAGAAQAGQSHTWTSEDGYTDFLLCYTGVASPNTITLRLNDSDTTKPLNFGADTLGTTAGTAAYPRYCCLSLLGQFCRIRQVGGYLTGNSSAMAGSFTEENLVRFDDTCAMQSLTLTFPAGYTGGTGSAGTIQVWAR